MSYPGNPSLPPDIQERLLTTFDQSLDLAAAGNLQEALLGCDFLLRMDPRFEPARVLADRLKTWSGPSGPAIDDLRVGVRAAAGATAAPEESFADLGWSDHEHESAPYVARFLRDGRAALERGERSVAERLLAKARSLDEANPEVASLAAALESSASDFVTDVSSFAELSDLGARAASTPDRPESAGAPGALGAPPASSEDPRIAELLSQGAAAFERGEHQNAIDAWSRVFLIDIDHAEAGRRIEEARRFKAEAERKTEELFQDGVARYEEGDREAAREIFTRLLASNPNHLAAREMMERLGEAADEASPAAAASARAVPAAGEPAAAQRRRGAKAALKEEIMVPPEPGERRAAAATAAPAAEAGRAGRRARSRGPLVAAAALLVVAAAGAWLWTQRDRLFPNRASASASAPAPAGDRALATSAVARAERLHAAGNTSAAVALLRRVGAEDPAYQRAQDLIAQWEALEEPAAPQLEPAAATRRAQWLGSARQAMAEGRFALAGEWLARAAEIAPLDAEESALARQASDAIAPYAAQLDLFRQGEWESVLPQLWRLHEADPSNRDVVAMLVDCYFNLGVRELQREAPDAATDKFREALGLAPDDGELRRTARFAEAYRARNLDLQYRIFVKHLPFRGGAAAA
jgi:tetratricopeptide (TPR) repeat protein